MVGRGGNAPPKPEGNGFTARLVILSDTYQYMADMARFELAVIPLRQRGGVDHWPTCPFGREGGT